MALNIFRRKPLHPTIAPLYGAIVAQARRPLFYAEWRVADTPEGRFDMIVLHLALVVRRLRRAPETREASQHLFDHFCRDMEDNLREMGVGDLSVPKKMRRLGEAFYGCAAAYDRALDQADDNALAITLARNIYADAPEVVAPAHRLAAYGRLCEHALSVQSDADLAAGRVQFPDPAKAIPMLTTGQAP